MLTSCCDFFDNSYRINGDGEIVTEERIVDSFDEIRSQIGANINIYESNESRVEITTYENLLAYLQTNVKNDVLTISFDNVCVCTDETITINVYTPSVKKYSLSGAGNLVSELPMEEISISGAGNVHCSGDQEEVTVSISGAGDINLYAMPVENIYISISGSGTVKTQVEKHLDVSISGVGNIYYKGNPSISSSISGVGKIVDSN